MANLDTQIFDFVRGVVEKGGGGILGESNNEVRLECSNNAGTVADEGSGIAIVREDDLPCRRFAGGRCVCKNSYPLPSQSVDFSSSISVGKMDKNG